jgi:hypothetical protein
VVKINQWLIFSIGQYIVLVNIFCGGVARGCFKAVFISIVEPSDIFKPSKEWYSDGQSNKKRAQPGGWTRKLP